MRNEKKLPQPKIQNLELNRETIQDLGDEESEGVEGGAFEADVDARTRASCYCTMKGSWCHHCH